VTLGTLASPASAATTGDVTPRAADGPVTGAAAGVLRHARPTTWRGRALARVGVLGALAGATVVVPTMSQGSDGSTGSTLAVAEVSAGASLPSTVSALTATPLSLLPPASLVSSDGALAARGMVAASRAEERDPLPGCDGSTRAPGQNGLLATQDLCTLWDGHTQLRADAAVSLAQFNQAFVARFGADMCLSSGYRSLAQQRVVKAQKGGLAAEPGKSNHGWGLAVDFCSSLTSGAAWTWLNENAAAFGWENPSWARPGGSGPYERWHWEYTKGVKQDGEYYG